MRPFVPSPVHLILRKFSNRGCPQFYLVNFSDEQGLSPRMIIFRVTTGRSFTNFRALDDSLISNPIQFARRSFDSSSFQSTWSRELRRDSASPDTERGLNASVNDPNRAQSSMITDLAEEKGSDGDRQGTE